MSWTPNTTYRADCKPRASVSGRLCRNSDGILMQAGDGSLRKFPPRGTIHCEEIVDYANSETKWKWTAETRYYGSSAYQQGPFLRGGFLYLIYMSWWNDYAFYIKLNALTGEFVEKVNLEKPLGLVGTGTAVITYSQSGLSEKIMMFWMNSSTSSGHDIGGGDATVFAWNLSGHFLWANKPAWSGFAYNSFESPIAAYEGGNVLVENMMISDNTGEILWKGHQPLKEDADEVPEDYFMLQYTPYMIREDGSFSQNTVYPYLGAIAGVGGGYAWDMEWVWERDTGSYTTFNGFVDIASDTERWVTIQANLVGDHIWRVRLQRYYWYYVDESFYRWRTDFTYRDGILYLGSNGNKIFMEEGADYASHEGMVVTPAGYVQGVNGGNRKRGYKPIGATAVSWQDSEFVKYPFWNSVSNTNRMQKQILAGECIIYG